jgi:hypothetical protein
LLFSLHFLDVFGVLIVLWFFSLCLARSHLHHFWI